MYEELRRCLDSIKKSLEEISNLGYDGIETICDRLKLPLEDKTLVAFAALIDDISCKIDGVTFQIESLLDGYVTIDNQHSWEDSNFEALSDWEETDENTSAFPEDHEEEPNKSFLVMSMCGDRWFSKLELAKAFAERSVERGSTDWAFVAEKGMVVAEYRKGEKNE